MVLIQSPLEGQLTMNSDCHYHIRYKQTLIYWTTSALQILSIIVLFRTSYDKRSQCCCFLLWRYVNGYVSNVVTSGIVTSGVVISGIVTSGIVTSGVVISGVVISGIVTSHRRIFSLKHAQEA